MGAERCSGSGCPLSAAVTAGDVGETAAVGVERHGRAIATQCAAWVVDVLGCESRAELRDGGVMAILRAFALRH